MTQAVTLIWKLELDTKISDRFMKKHFILLGKFGLIYFSWLFALLFLGLIFHYEKTTRVSAIATILFIVFFALLIYTWFNSYFTAQKIKLPYRPQIKSKFTVQQKWQWHGFILYSLQVEKMQKYWVLYYSLKKD